MEHEGRPKLSRPQAARERVSTFVRTYGRTEDPGLPPQAVPLRELFELEDNEELFFGVATDAVDYIFSQQALGLMSVDHQKGTVTSNR